MPKIDEQNPNFGNSLHYPDDLGVGYTHPDCVKFTIGTKPGVSLEGVQKVFKERLTASKVAIGVGLQKNITDIQNQISGKSTKEQLEELNAKLKTAKTQFSNFQERIGKGETNFDDFIGIFKDAGNTLLESQKALIESEKKNKFSPESTVYLPMPENLVYNEPVDWSGTDLGMMKGAADALLGKGGSDNALGGAALGQAGNVLAGGAGAIVSKLLGGGLLGGAVLGGLGGGAALQGAIESNLRVKSNPFKEQTFQGVGFRPFEFSFVFNARSQSEVITIKEIINKFREYSKPSLDSPESAIFRYPGEFKIEFLTNNNQDNFTTNTWLPKLKPCICKSVNTNFTTAGWKSFEDGAPTTITLQLGFEEVDIITKDSVLEGY